MPHIRARNARRNPFQFQDGIHLDFRPGRRHYVKAPGVSPTLAPFTSLFTFTGDNLSKYRGASGLLVSSVTNTPRVEYDVNGNLLGLLIEGARTNIGLWSDDGTNAAWVKSNVTAAKTSTGPDGVANSATRLTATAGNGTTLQTVTSGSATRAYSVWLKRITGTGNIDLTVDNGSTWTTKTITSSWERYDISQAAVTNPVFGVRIVTSADAIDFYGNQLESAAFPSSLIPTTTGSVARAADSVTRTFGSEYVITKGSTYVEVVPSAGTVLTGGGVFALDTAGRHVYFTNTPTARIFDGTNFAAAGTPVAGALMKIASAFDSNGLSISANGSAVATNSFDGVWGGGTTILYLGDTSAGVFLFGHIRRLSYWPERKSNAELVRMTA